MAQLTRVEREDDVRRGHRCDQRLNTPLRKSVYKRSQQIIRRNEPRSIGARFSSRVDYRDRSPVGDRLNQVRAPWCGCGDRRARRGWLLRVVDVNRDVLSRCGMYRLRMKHLRAEESQIGGFRKRAELHRASARKNLRVGSHQSRHVFPDLNVIRIERGADNRGGVVRAFKPQRRRRAVSR